MEGFEPSTSAYHLSYFIRLLLLSQRAIVNAHKVYEHGVIARLNYIGANLLTPQCLIKYY
jgi:hypothetical protein